VYTQNGFLFATLTGKNQGLDVQLHVDENAAYSVMSEASDPVVESLIAYHEGRIAPTSAGSTGSTGDSGATDSTGNTEDTRATTTTTTSDTQVLAGTTTNDNGGNTDSGTDAGNGTGTDTGAGNNTNTNNTVAHTRVAGSSDFLNEVVTNSHGAPAEAAARLAIYGGTAQAALGASSSTTDAIAARLGVGSAGGLTIANNGQGAALWLAPVYKSHDSDGFDSQGLDYGVDLNLYGVALGADLELMPGFTAGLMFNVGSGDVDGKGNTAANNTSNDFDYWGAALYGSYRYDALTVAADIGYTVVDNDLEATTGMDKYGKLESSADSTALTFGVTAKYAFDFNTVEVAPHAGLRYTNVDLDDYTVTANGEDVAHFDAGSISVFSIPVGVTMAKEFVGDNWSVKPMFDLTLTGNFGDDEVDGTVSWTGVDNLTTGVSSEFLDNFTYGATLGVEAKTGSFSFGLGVNYTGSSNADEYGVNANARFVF
ncbi:MAG: autotransporter outer membrane beta-barrel domain-containing protein, partial [Candidatus Anaerobiospirillum pullicola]|nr:autotransporter outer membrane beta-barrel domain-containing protein [Candidatus Anaerobiospirillum pullicola]